jgi:hypothetical protein
MHSALVSGLGVVNRSLFRPPQHLSRPRAHVGGLGQFDEDDGDTDDFLSDLSTFDTSLPTITPLPDLPINYDTSTLAPVPTIGTTTNPATLSSQGLTPAQIAAIFNGAVSSATAIYKTTQTPGLIPGTSVVYNPATGQLINSSLLTTAGGVVSTASLSSLSSLLPLLLIGGVALVVIEGMGKK